jgi:hypothetical protein
MYDIVNLIFL